MLEREIDQRVYRIHELSPEEIAGVEWGTPISTEQKIKTKEMTAIYLIRHIVNLLNILRDGGLWCDCESSERSSA